MYKLRLLVLGITSTSDSMVDAGLHDAIVYVRKRILEAKFNKVSCHRQLSRSVVRGQLLVKFVLLLIQKRLHYVKMMYQMTKTQTHCNSLVAIVALHQSMRI